MVKSAKERAERERDLQIQRQVGFERTDDIYYNEINPRDRVRYLPYLVYLVNNQIDKIVQKKIY